MDTFMPAVAFSRAAVLGALACTAIAGADIIIDQPDTGLVGYASQDFTDMPAYSCSVFDDFTITQTYNLTSLRVYGENSIGGGSAFDTDVRLRIFSTPDLTGVALATVSGTDTDGVLDWDLTGITLGPGTYWLAAQVVRPYSPGGQWYWRASETMNGSHAMWHNPGGGFGYGTAPVSTEVIGSEHYDMAMTLEGVVPAPGAVAALALGGLMRGFRTRGRSGPRAR